MVDTAAATYGVRADGARRTGSNRACQGNNTSGSMRDGLMTQKRSSRACEAHLGSGRLFRYRVSELPTCSASLFRPKARCRTAAAQTGGAVSELCFCPHSSARRTRTLAKCTRYSLLAFRSLCGSASFAANSAASAAEAPLFTAALTLVAVLPVSGDWEAVAVLPSPERPAHLLVRKQLVLHELPVAQQPPARQRPERPQLELNL